MGSTQPTQPPISIPDPLEILHPGPLEQHLSDPSPLPPEHHHFPTLPTTKHSPTSTHPGFSTAKSQKTQK